MQSILQTDKRCYFCGTGYNLHLHHIYGGCNRQISDANGFIVYLCANHHNFGTRSVHNCEEMSLVLKRACQEVYEKNNSREDFIKLIGRNYL